MPSTHATEKSVPGVAALTDRRVAVATAVTLLPVLGTALVMTALYFTVGLSPVPNAATLVYGVANVAVVAGLYAALPPDARRAVFRYRPPSGAELVASVALAVAAVVVVAPVVVGLASELGLSGGPSVASVESLAGAAVVTSGAVLVAPVAEEVLFRGYLFGTLAARFDARVAVAGSSVVFGCIHVFLSGVPGVAEALLVGLGFAAVRHRYDNLAGVGVAHAAVNAYYVAAGLGLVPSLV